MGLFQKGAFRKQTERERIQQQLEEYYRFIKEQFSLFLDSINNPDVLREVREHLEAGQPEEALRIVDSYVVRLANQVISQIPGLGASDVEALADQLKGGGASVSFNPASPAVIDAMTRNRMQFIVQFTQDQRQAVNQALTQALREGAGTREQMRAFKDSIGLTSYQQRMVDNYRRLLETNSRQALDRALRDRRYDRGLENAIEAGEVLPQDRIDLMVDRYRDRLLQLRGETIARTESQRVAEEVRHISTMQVAEQAGIPHAWIIKQWMSTRDARVRDTHRAMDGQARMLDDPFESPSGATLMHPGDSTAPPEEVINCRCTVQHHIFGSEEEARTFLQANQ